MPQGFGYGPTELELVTAERDRLMSMVGQMERTLSRFRSALEEIARRRTAEDLGTKHLASELDRHRSIARVALSGSA